MAARRPYRVPKKDTLLGIIENEGSYARVIAGENSGQVGNNNQLPIVIEGMEKVGTYKGKIYLSGMDVGQGEVDLQIVLSHKWFWAVLAILAGIFLAFVSQYFLETGRVSRDLKRRRGAIKGNYCVAAT